MTILDYNRLMRDLNGRSAEKLVEEIGKRFFDVTHAYVESCFYPWKSARVNPYGEVYS